MISINITKAKDIAHDVRRAKRAEEFAPLDEVIMKRLPGKDAAEAEAGRQFVREKFAEVQVSIDAAQSADELKSIINAL